MSAVMFYSIIGFIVVGTAAVLLILRSLQRSCSILSAEIADEVSDQIQKINVATQDAHERLSKLSFDFEPVDNLLSADAAYYLNGAHRLIDGLEERATSLGRCLRGNLQDFTSGASLAQSPIVIRVDTVNTVFGEPSIPAHSVDSAINLLAALLDNVEAECANRSKRLAVGGARR